RAARLAAGAAGGRGPRSGGRAGGRARGMVAPLRAAGGTAPVQSGARPAAPPQSDPARRAGASAAHHLPPHRLRRLVDRRPAARDRGPLRSLLAGHIVSAPRAAGPVRGLRELAARLVTGRAPGAAAPLLA